MKYIWINPVVDRMIRPELLDGFLVDNGYVRAVCRENWGQAVKDKYKAAVNAAEQVGETVVDMRCPMACGLVRALERGRDGQPETVGPSRDEQHGTIGLSGDGQHGAIGRSRDEQHGAIGLIEDEQYGAVSLSRDGQQLVFPDIEPILIHCAREISGRGDLKGNEKLIITPCRSLADYGNGLKLEETRFLSWNDFLAEIDTASEADRAAELKRTGQCDCASEFERPGQCDRTAEFERPAQSDCMAADECVAEKPGESEPDWTPERKGINAVGKTCKICEPAEARLTDEAARRQRRRALDEMRAESTPIPLGFFDELQTEKKSLSGHSQIEAFFSSGNWKEFRLTELLYCEGGCHNGDGVVKAAKEHESETEERPKDDV